MTRSIIGIATVLSTLALVWAAPLAAAGLVAFALISGLAIGAGAEALARLHPAFGPVVGRPLAGYWVGPGITASTAVVVAGQLEAPVVAVLPVVAALLVGVLLFAQEREVSGPVDDRWVSLAAALVLYITAFALFAVIYSSRGGSWGTSLLIGVVGLLLAFSLYRPTRGQQSRTLLYAALTGLGLAELTFVLGTWVAAGLLGAAVLLLYFYVVVGLVQAVLDGTFQLRLAVEYGIVGLAGLGLVFSTSPWQL